MTEKPELITDDLAILSNCIVEAMKDKKAKNIIELDLSKLNNRFTDKFIICHADSDRQVEAIASWIEEKCIMDAKEKIYRREGYENREWILLDYVNLVVHIFLKDKREYYAIEELWGDADITQHKELN